MGGSVETFAAGVSARCADPVDTSDFQLLRELAGEASREPFCTGGVLGLFKWLFNVGVVGLLLLRFASSDAC